MVLLSNMALRIWEKKYGKNANHTKKQREEMEASGRGRNQRPGVAGHKHTPAKSSSGPAHRREAEALPRQYNQQSDAGWGQRNNSGPSSTKAAATHTQPVARQPRPQ